MKKFSKWANDGDLHNQLNRFVSDIQTQFAQIPAATTPAPVEAAAASQGGGIGSNSAGGGTVSSVVAGTGITTTSMAGGAVEVSNAGVTEVVAGGGIAVSATTGIVVISAEATGLAIFIVETEPFASSPYAIAANQNTFLAASAGSAANFVADLPAATGSAIIVAVKKMDANAFVVAITPNGTDTIDGVNAAVDVTFQYDTVRLIDAGAGTWLIW